MSPLPGTVWRWLAPALLLLALLLALGGLPRGIDLTDESFYWLHYRHWQQFNFQVTFFGAYLDLPFRLMGEDATLMRAMGLLLVLGSGAVFLRAAQQHLQGTGPALLMGAALALTHYNFFWTLRSPSYNTLVLVCMLLSSGLLLAWLRSSVGLRRDALALGYGLLIGVCLFSKATTAVALVLLHALLLIAEHRSWTLGALLRAAAAALLGFALNLLYVQLRQPEWFAALRNGLEFARTIETRDALLSLRGLYWHWAQAALPLAGLLLALLGLLTAAWRGGERLRNAALLLIVALPVALLCTLDRGRVLWWPATAVAALGIWLLAWRAGAPRAAGIGLVLLGLLGPFAYSIGTNLGLSMHTQLIAVLPLSLLWLGLQQLQQRDLFGARSFALASALLVLPGLAAQAWPWVSQQATYRQATSLAQADRVLPADSPLAGLRSDAVTVAALERFRGRIAAAGFRAGQPLLDFTGANPGLVHLAGGRPLGLAWMLGSYPGSREAAALLVARQAPGELRQAWLIVSPDAKRHIAEPTRLLAERLGQQCHRLADRFVLDLPAADGIGLPPAPITVELWQPVCAP